MVAVAFIAFLIATSCKHSSDDPADADKNPQDTTKKDTTKNDTTKHDTTLCFTRDIQPLFASNCAQPGCHDAETHEKGRDFSTYAGVMRDVKAGKPNDSKIVEVMTTSSGDDRMPPAPRQRLTAEQINLIKRWITEGAKNEPCKDNGPCNTDNVTFSATVKPILSTNCYGCHNAQVTNGKLNLTQFAQVQTYAQNGKLYKALTAQGGYIQMPLTGPLDDCSLNQIKVWIDAGAPNN